MPVRNRAWVPSITTGRTGVDTRKTKPALPFPSPPPRLLTRACFLDDLGCLLLSRPQLCHAPGRHVAYSCGRKSGLLCLCAMTMMRGIRVRRHLVWLLRLGGELACDTPSQAACPRARRSFMPTTHCVLGGDFLGLSAEAWLGTRSLVSKLV